MKRKKICTVVGARPQFVKAGLISKELAGKCREVLIHTGQHYDQQMSDVFFNDLDLKKPTYNLNIGSGQHGVQTGKMLQKIEAVLIKEKPDLALVYGDTNSTIAGALAAVKLGIPLAHVEAGLRSFNTQMPEEINRVLTDRLSKLLFCPTETAVQNLKKENIKAGVHNVGDVMYDLALIYGQIAEKRSTILTKLDLVPNSYSLLTVHRAINTDDPATLQRLLATLASTGKKMVFPIHPRTKKALSQLNLSAKVKSLIKQNIMIIDPLGYIDMVKLEKNARFIVTDSGGVQKEAYFFAVPCITLRNETEWGETLRGGWNTLVGSDASKISRALGGAKKRQKQVKYYGNGKAHQKIVKIIMRSMN